ncbi:MAG: polysaccharide (de)acetylase [Flavobacteriaceae bacterium]|nr:polysaccharide (de)acetylase [Flavobacteriaceae bacterium]
MKQTLLNNIKNIYGWKTKRKIVVFSVDDYGNVRLDSIKARKNMDKAGLKVLSRFDALDTLETREDLEILFETLSSVKDKNKRSAVFTPFALPCNINFEAMAKDGNIKYIYETLPETYQKLETKDANAYSGTWNLWQEGIKNGLLHPQFHGREHLNLKVFKEKLHQKDHELRTALQNRSYTSIFKSGYDTIGYTAAFDFWEESENEVLKDILIDGLNQFERVYGYRAKHFTPPTTKIHPIHHQLLKENGIDMIDINLIHQQHIGSGRYKKSTNYTGKKTKTGQIYIVRNVVFEPTHKRGFDWVNYSLKQVEAAFRWHRPAIISSHRVNFCGHIDPKNREKGIKALKELLKRIVRKWPEVEFMSSVELGEFMDKDKRQKIKDKG